MSPESPFGSLHAQVCQCIRSTVADRPGDHRVEIQCGRMLGSF